MRSLYLKIFLWFGLAMIVVNVASFVTGIIAERQFQPPRQNPTAPMFGVYAQTAVDIFERDGPPALASYLKRVEEASHIHAALLNERGEEVSGRAIPPGTQELTARLTAEAPFVFDPNPPLPLAARTIHSAQGKLYTLVGEMPRRDFPRPPPRPGEPNSLRFVVHMFGQHLLPVLVIGAIFCYFLARYLTTPIVKLRDTAHQLADGNLTARVSNKLIERQDEIGYLGREFNLMAGRIESHVELQQRLLRDISHELRSPLARLGVALELVRRRASPEMETGLDRIGRESETINVMIGQLLSLSRIESGTERLKNVKIDLCALIEDVASDADFEAGSHQRSVRVMNCDSCTTIGVAEMLRSAVENVVRNAVHYTAIGTEVEISLACEGIDGRRNAIVNVRDHGAGVPEAALKEIFRPFYRVEDARDRQTGGNGLGLAIASRAVHLHGGSIKALNAPDGGLIVEIRLPLREKI